MDASAPALGLVNALAAELRAAGVRYCHWKSNTTLGEALLGRGDLDLLVDRADARTFQEVARACGFTRTVLQRTPRVPGLEHLHGLDPVTGELVHLHVHYQLVLGHDTTKNHRLPLERAFLDTADTSGVVPVPPPELEYAVLVIRMVLKYAILDEVVWRALRGGTAGPTPAERAELDDLSSRIDRAELERIVAEHVTFLPVGLFHACEASLRRDPGLLRRLRLGRDVRRALEPFARHGPAAAATLRVGRRFATAGLRRADRMPRFALGSGGAVVAFIGGDGAGKSTTLDRLEEWLDGEFDVHRVHIGRPPWSTTTTLVRAALKVVAALLPSEGPATAPRIDEPAASGFGRFRAAVWHACTARDRSLAHQHARRLAHRGWLVLADRFPHGNLEEMDVPQVRRRAGSGGPTGVLELLARLEEHYHDRIPPPDLLVVLRVDPEIAVERKTDEPSRYVRRRSHEVWDATWEEAHAHVIDASRPVDEVVDEVRALLWAALT